MHYIKFCGCDTELCLNVAIPQDLTLACVDLFLWENTECVSALFVQDACC
jgi:hypothetical protein